MTIDIFTVSLPLSLAAVARLRAPAVAVVVEGPARGAPGHRHLVISQSAAAHQNNVEAIRANCALMAPSPLSFSSWLERHLRTHTHTHTHLNASHVHKRLPFSQHKHPHALKITYRSRNWENNIIYFSQVEDERFSVYTASVTFSMFALIFAFRAERSK